LPEPYESFMEGQISLNQFRILPIEIRHAAALTLMPHHPKDPFDRLLIAQALVEGVSIVSGDVRFEAYGVTRVW
jgi:PIN domain nuclease of toxin-antitoxin system